MHQQITPVRNEPGTGSPVSLPGLPADSIIRVVEATDSRWVVEIPPGGDQGKRAGLFHDHLARIYRG